MKAWVNIGARTLLVITVATACASAQERAQGDDTLPAYVAADVRVSKVNGTVVDAALASIHDGQLELLTRGGTETLPLDTVARIERRGDSVKNGLIAGAVIGGLMGFAMCAECEGIGVRIYATAMSAAMYGFVGAGIDAMYTGWTTVYVRPSRSARALAGTPGAVVSLRLRF